MKRALVMALSVILALAVAAPIASGKKPPSQPQDVNALTEQWWTWALAVPSPLDGDYKAGRKCKGEFVEGVFFLAGTQGGDATRTCIVPADTALLFPVVNAFVTEEERTPPLVYPEYPTNFVDAALANGELYATLDGEDLSFSRINRTFQPLILADPNIFGVPGGEYGHPNCADPTRCLTASDGLWVYLPEGLEKGKHTLTFGANFTKPDGSDFSMNITYNLIVV